MKWYLKTSESEGSSQKQSASDLDDPVMSVWTVFTILYIRNIVSDENCQNLSE